MADQSNRSAAGIHTLVVRAIFVPDGEQPPEEMNSVFNPLRFRATRDAETGVITCDNAGTTFNGDISAVFHPDDPSGQDDGEDASDDGQRTLDPGKQSPAD